MDTNITSKVSPPDTEPVQKEIHKSQPEVHVTGELIAGEPAPSPLEEKGATAEDVMAGDDDDYDDESDYDNEHELIYSDEEDESYVIEPSVHKGVARTEENAADKTGNDVQPDTLDQCVELTEQTLKMVQELEGGTHEEENVELDSKEQLGTMLKQPAQDTESGGKDVNKDNVSPGDAQASSHDTNDSVKSSQNDEHVSIVSTPSEATEQGVEVSQRTLKLVHEITSDGKMEKRIRVSESDKISERDVEEEVATDVGDREIVNEEFLQEATTGVQLENPVFGKEFKSNEMDNAVSNPIEPEKVTEADNPMVPKLEKEEKVQEVECLPDESEQDLITKQAEGEHVVEDTLVSSKQPETTEDNSTAPRDTEINLETQQNVQEVQDKTQPSESEKEPDLQKTPPTQTADYQEEVVSSQAEDEKKLNADENKTSAEQVMTQDVEEQATQGTETEKEVAGPKKLPLHIRQGYLDEKKKKEKEQAKGFDFSVLIFVGAAVFAIIAIVWMIAYSLGINS